MQQNDSRLI